MSQILPLPRKFYEQSTLDVAKHLLGKYLLRETAHGLLETQIVDVEAYVGPQDKACHASKGRTKRTEVMFGPAGYTYVYMIYGMYHCLNLVTEEEGYPAAILIRGLAIAPQAGKGQVFTHIDGPGRVCRFLELDRTYNALDATIGRVIWVENRGTTVPPDLIEALPRIGIDYAGEWAQKPWRFRLPISSSKRNRRTPPR